MTDLLQSSRDSYLARFEAFEKSSAARSPKWLKRIREEAAGRFASLGFPTSRQEEWKYTSVLPIVRADFQPAANGISSVRPDSLERFLFPGLSAIQLVFVNGRFAPKLSAIGTLPEGLRIGSLAEAVKTNPAALEGHLARYASSMEHPFVALNTAFHQDGLFLEVPRGLVLETPVHLLFFSTQGERPTVSYPRNLILVGENSQATLLESYAGLEHSIYFTNAVTEILQEPGSVVDHYKLQRESDAAFHVATLQVHQERSSRFSCHSISIGGALVRNDINALLDAEGADCTLNGLYLIGDRQHEDNHTRIEHAKSHCTSHELYKGILDGASTGVFSGKIHVRKDAQKTDAKQTNKNLILSDDATINTKPQLEIFADDVKCTHGATIGQLDEESVFYLRSRGIGEEAARNILTGAFARDIIDRVKLEPVRNRLEEQLLSRLEQSFR